MNTDWYRVEEVSVAFRCYASATSYKIVLALPIYDLQLETETKETSYLRRLRMNKIFVLDSRVHLGEAKVNKS